MQNDPQHTNPHLPSVYEQELLERDEQEHRQEVELKKLTFQFQIATAIVAFVLFAVLVMLLVDYVGPLKSHSPPDWFIDICKVVISAGLMALTTGTMATIGGILNKNKLKDDEVRTRAAKQVQTSEPED